MRQRATSVDPSQPIALGSTSDYDGPDGRPIAMPNAMKPSALGNRRTVLRNFAFAALYFAEGAPIGFLWIALPTILRQRGGSTAEIGSLLALIALPWALKFLWAPLVDTLRGRLWSLRAWIVAAQVGMAATLLPLAWIDPLELLGPIGALLVLHALCAATQDVAIDALAIASVGSDRRGNVNAWMQAGMFSGRMVFGGMLLRLREYVGDSVLVWAMVAVLLASVPAARLLDEPLAVASVRVRWREFGSALAAAVRLRTTWLGLGFAATGAAGFEAVGAFAGPHLLDRGVGAARVGDFMAVPVTACTIVGGFAGGILTDRLGRLRAVAACGIVMALAVLAVARAAWLEPSVSLTLVTLGTMYFTVGLFTTASYALFMDLTDRRLGSTQFSGYMGATNLCESWSVFVAGRTSARAGYASAFALMAGASLLALIWLVGLRARPGREVQAQDGRPGARGGSP